MTHRKPRYAGRFRHVNSSTAINILLLNHELHELLEFYEFISNTDETDGTDFFWGSLQYVGYMYVNSWQTINMVQSLCTSVFEGSHGRRLHVFVHKLNTNVLWWVILV